MTMADEAAIFGGLRELRRGKGLDSEDLRERAGNALLALAGVSPRDSTQVIRERLSQLIRRSSAELPGDLRIPLLSSLALHTEARQPHLEERLDWLARYLARDSRTARRRADEGLRQLAVLLASKRPDAHRLEQEAEAWRVDSFKVLLRLDRAGVETFEQRRIISNVEGLTEVVMDISVPRVGQAPGKPHTLEGDLLYGGRLLGGSQPSVSYFRFVIELPHPLSVGEAHEYGMRLRIPPDQPMAPHYVFVPHHDCETFELRVRFGDSVPPLIWRVTAIAQRMIDDRQTRDDVVRPDRFGELHVAFHGLRRGLGYGIQWEPVG